MTTLENPNQAVTIRARAASVSSRRARPLERFGRRLVGAALSHIRRGSLRIVDGEQTFSTPDAPADALLVRIHDPAFYSAAAFGGSVGIAEAYMEGHWTTDDLPGLIELLTVNLSAAESLEGPLTRLLAPLSRLAYWMERNSREGSRRNIVAHYDLGNEFFRLFLDPTMTYSCGIFDNGADTLEAAQIEKIDRACRKLDLRPTDHLLEIGTGWGALALHAAKTYGCRVTTTTISDEQHRFAVSRIAEAGLSDRVQVLRSDYRDLHGQFNKLVSIEMIEAVGRQHLGTFFQTCARCLRPDGAALIQAIVIRDQYFARASRRRDFLKKYIFPGSCLPSVAAMQHASSTRTDLRTWHTEDLAPHYARTLALWREAFMARLEDVRAQGYDDRFIRMWEYYLAYCEGAFRARHVGLVQMLFTRPDSRLQPASPRTC